MYLSRLILNPHSRRVRSEIANPYEMHRTLSHAFSGATFGADRHLENTAGLLFRLDVHPRTGIPSLLVQSQIEPDWFFLQSPDETYLLNKDALPLDVENPAVKPVELRLVPEQMLAFRLRANPTAKKIQDGQKQGRRVGLLQEKEQLLWLQRKVESAGGMLLSANLTCNEFIRGKLYRGDYKHNLSFISVQFDGVIRVKYPALLVDAVRVGIGSAKGFGFGLLSLAPVT